MSMPFSFSAKVSLFSMRRRLIRTILALIPCILLIAIMFIGSTIPNGLVNELDKQVLANAESRQEIVMLDSSLFAQTNFIPGGQTPPTVDFSKSNYEIATKSSYIDEVYPQFGQAAGITDSIGNIGKTNLIFNGTSAQFAKLYTDKNFEFVAGQPIPVLINPNTIASTNYNWGDKNTLDLDYSNAKDMESKMIFKQLSEPEKLVGTTFEVEFGKFPSYPEAFEEQSGGGFGIPKAKIIKITDSDREILDKRIKEIYGSYWNVDELKKPIKYQFVIAGLLKGQNSPSQGFMPNEAVVNIWKSLYTRQANSRTDKVLDKEFLESETTKTELKDNYIQLSNMYSYAAPTLQKDPSVSAWEVQLTGIGVPGLLVESAKNARGDNYFKETGRLDITKDNFRADSAVVKLKSPDDRAAYIKYLEDNNMHFFDNSPLAVIRGIRKGATIFVTWLTIILGAIVALILVTTVSRFVADSRREIGVWRAIGATRTDISKLVLTRMLLLLAIGIGLGIILGWLISLGIANSIASSFSHATGGFNPYSSQGFVSTIVISLLGGTVPTIEASKLMLPNWPLLGSRLAILGLITLLIGLLPAWRAARISPVTAIRDSE